MSLIKCPECGKVFSDRAAHCPQCGLPTADALKAIVNVDNTPIDQPAAAEPVDQPAPAAQPQKPYYAPNYGQPQPKKQNSALLYTLICVVIVLAIILVAIFVHDKFGNAGDEVDSTDSVATMQTLPADTLALPQEEEKVDLPKVVTTPVAAPVEEIPEESEGVEIQQTPSPSAPETPSAPAEPTTPTQPTE